MTEWKKILEHLDRAVDHLSGVANGLDNLEHETSDEAYQLYTDAEDLYEQLMWKESRET